MGAELAAAGVNLEPRARGGHRPRGHGGRERAHRRVRPPVRQHGARGDRRGRGGRGRAGRRRGDGHAQALPRPGPGAGQHRHRHRCRRPGDDGRRRAGGRLREPGPVGRASVRHGVVGHLRADRPGPPGRVLARRPHRRAARAAGVRRGDHLRRRGQRRRRPGRRRRRAGGAVPRRRRHRWCSPWTRRSCPRWSTPCWSAAPPTRRSPRRCDAAVRTALMAKAHAGLLG